MFPWCMNYWMSLRQRIARSASGRLAVSLPGLSLNKAHSSINPRPPVPQTGGFFMKSLFSRIPSQWRLPRKFTAQFHRSHRIKELVMKETLPAPLRGMLRGLI
jgi:hypothetical protein